MDARLFEGRCLLSSGCWDVTVTVDEDDGALWLQATRGGHIWATNLGPRRAGAADAFIAGCALVKAIEEHGGPSWQAMDAALDLI